VNKIKFGIFLPFYAFQAKTPTEHFETLKTIVLESERLGYDSVWLDDHLMYNNWPILDCWTTLSALSSITSKIRLGTMVSCNQHRNPALLAKIAATVDVLSNGRLEFGIGAGIQEAEHTAYGFGFPKLSVRVERMDEALEVVRKLWTQKRVNFQGRHYSLKAAICEPKPIQKPHPPIIVGGCEEKHTLKVTAKHANRFDWGFLPTMEAYKRKLQVLENHCSTFGKKFGDIERSCWPSGQVLIAQDQKTLDGKVKKLKPSKMSMENYEKGTLVGTPDKFLEQLKVYTDLGVTYFILYFADMPSTDGLKLFSENVAKKM
jgi:F420-dependent oxidoreductase-like protein